MLVLKDNTENIIENNLHLELAQDYSNKSLKSLFNINDSLILSTKKIENKFLWKVEDKKIICNNIMGFIGLQKEDKHINVRISSRFAKDCHEDYFLHYMLQKVFLGTLIDHDISAKADNVYAFYAYLFPTYLKNALQIGIYKEYKHNKYNDIHLRGSIDIARHIKKNTPFAGNIAYTIKEHSYNNDITQLIRHTIEYINELPFGQSVLTSSLDTCENIQLIREITPNYYSIDRHIIIAKSSNCLSNPHYAPYERLRKLCLQILNADKLNLNHYANETMTGILFDGALLWEKYLFSLLKDINYTYSERICLGKSENSNLIRFPDLYNQEKKTVLDAKYKRIDAQVQRDDAHQILSYMYALQASTGILAYPCPEKSISKSYDLEGYGGKLLQKSLAIPCEEESFAHFSDKMCVAEKEFIDSLIY